MAQPKAKLKTQPTKRPTKPIPTDPRNPPSEWLITSSILNTLWGDFFGRLVPLLWAGAPMPLTFDGYLGAIPEHEGKEEDINIEAYHGLCRDYVLLYIDLFEKNIEDGKALKKRLKEMDGAFGDKAGFGTRSVLPIKFRLPDDYFMQGGGIEVTDRFIKRLEMLRSYLENGPELTGPTKGGKSGPRAMPIRFFRDDDVFDFILSDDGLDLFLPSSPFSKPGKPRGRLAEVYRAYMYRETGRRPVHLPLPGAGFPRERPAIQLDTPGGPANIHLDKPGVFKWLMEQGFQVGHGDADQETKKTIQGWLDRVLATGIDGGVFSTCLRPNRRWQMEGSVYRAVMAEFPRIVANIWLEETIEGKSDIRAGYTSNKQGGLRDILEGRLELGLPPAEAMMCCGRTRSVTWDWENGDGVTPSRVRKCSTDVLISDKGFLFPDPGEPPTEDYLLRCWVDGTAGNPVFTDCIPPGD